MPAREDVPVLRLPLGGSSHQVIRVYGFTAEEMVAPLVEIVGGGEYMNLTLEQAEKLAEGIKLAVRRARGAAIPTALDALLNRRTGT